MDLAGLPVPAPVLDSPATRHDLLFLLGRVAQAADASLEAERRCWRDLGAHALGLLDDACRRDDGGGRPEWWLAKAEREIACRGACPLRARGMLFVSQRVVDVLAFTRPRCDQLAEIVLVAFLRSGDLK